MTVIIRPSGGRWAGVDYVGGSTQTLSAAVELAMVNGGFATWAAGSGEDRLVPAQVRVPVAGSAAVEDPNNPGSALGGSGSVAVQALTADRALTAADHNVRLAMTANRSVTVGEGGIEPIFVNSTDGPLTLTITGTNGVIINGAANGSVSRVIPARGVLIQRVDAANSYDVPKPASVSASQAHRRPSALVKPRGSQQQFINSFAATGAWMKVRAPGKFKNVRIWVLSRGYNTAAGYQAAVAPTDRSGSASLTDSYLPRVGGVTYNNLASNSNVYGWRNMSWGGSQQNFFGVGSPAAHAPESVSGIVYPSAAIRSGWDAMPSDHAISTFVKTDWCGVPSVVADDGEYYLLVKIRRNSYLAANGDPGCYDWTTGQATSAATSKSLIAVAASKLPAGDYIADHTLQPTAAFASGTDTWQTVPFIVEFDMDVPDERVRSIAFVGESHFEGYFIPSTSLANVRAAYPNLVINYSNWGMSSNRSSEYYTNFENYLKAGLRVTDVVIHTLSTNDGSDSGSRVQLYAGADGAHEFAQSFAQISLKVDEYLRVGIRPWICLMFYGGGNATSYYNNPSWIAYCTRVRNLCAAKGIPLIDVADGWQYNSTWLPDNVHAGALGIAHFETKFEAAARAEFGA